MVEALNWRRADRVGKEERKGRKKERVIYPFRSIPQKKEEWTRRHGTGRYISKAVPRMEIRGGKGRKIGGRRE